MRILTFLKVIHGRIKKLPRIGLRNLKTAMSVFFCLLLYEFVLSSFLTSSDSLYACVAAIISMQDTVENSVTFGLNRLIGSTIGGVFGIFFLWLNSLIFDGYMRFFLVAVGIILVIYCSNLIKKKEIISIACVVFLVILISLDSTEPYRYAFYRILDTAIGIIVSVIINKYVNFKRQDTSLPVKND
jgi:uncharacterized membrane protein YgaE (UPF0421/DUF939 family)